MRELSFVVKCNPPKHTAQGSRTILKTKNGRFFIGKKSDSNAQQTQDDLLSLLYTFAPEKAFVGALKVEIKWVYAWRSGEAKKNRLFGFKYCDKKPDADNIMKLLFDCMTRCGFWVDDAQVADLRFEKMWGDEPRIEIKIFGE